MSWLIGLFASAVALFFSGLFRMSLSRFDINNSVDRLMFKEGYGHMLAFPTRPGTSSTATTGVPTNSIAGFAPACLFLNFKGSVGSLLYVNTGSNTSATWTNVV